MIPARLRDPFVLVEGFVVLNLLFLAPDVYFAHSVNAFAAWSQWVPVVFSVVASPLLAVAAWRSGLPPRRGAARTLGLAIGGAALLVGVAGMLLHLADTFFEYRTLRHLVYSAPFVAPLAYAGLGFLVLLDRMVEPRSLEWARWVCFLAMAGFLGNFGLSLADHAQNGFFDTAEWIPVVAAAFAVGLLLPCVAMPVTRRYLRLCAVAMAAEAAVGVAGLVLHLRANLHGPARHLLEDFLHGAPLLAPLLFPNLALLAAIGLVALARLPSASPSRAATAPAA